MADDPWLGVELAGYRLDTLVGRGGAGVVYRATHLRLGRSAAVKLLAGGLASDPEYQRRFEREAGLAASLQHPHIVPIYDAGYAQGVLYLAMAYIDGPNLADVIAAEGPMDVHRVWALLGGVAEALDSAHLAGLVHRDVKPANVLVTPPAPPRLQRGYLCDFGIARHTAPTGGASTGTGQFLGTLQYCAPEQIQGHSLDGRADQYALGCVVYQCLTGQLPYPADEPAAVVFAHVSAEPPRPSAQRPDLPAGTDAVIAQALAKDPADRFPSSAAFLHAIADTAGAGTSALPTAAASPHAIGSPTLIWPAGHRASQPETHTPSVQTAPLSGDRSGWFRWFRSVDRRVLVAVGLAVLLLAVAGIFYAHDRTARTVALLGTDQRGGDPFGPNLVVDGGLTPTARLDQTAGREPTGDQDGLYFDTTGTSSCNREALAALLKKDPKLADAWSGAVGGTGADASGYLGTLTPVRLRADTRVTAFSYTDGEAEPNQAVLQAGTAVLVDNRGQPKVDCAGSAPLAAPSSISNPHYDGTAWTGFNPTTLIEIHPAATLVREFGLVNPAGAAPFRRFAGTDGGQDIAQLPTTGRLDSHYILTGPMTHCEGYLSCQQDTGVTFYMDATFSGCPNSCTITTTGIRTQGGDGRENFTGGTRLTRVGDAWQYSGASTSACATKSNIIKGPMKGTQHFTITVTRSALTDGIWKATEIKMDEGALNPAMGSCSTSDRSFSLTGTAQ